MHVVYISASINLSPLEITGIAAGGFVTVLLIILLCVLVCFCVHKARRSNGIRRQKEVQLAKPQSQYEVHRGVYQNQVLTQVS